MIDVYISYAPEERDAAETVAEALARAGFSAWWSVSEAPSDDGLDDPCYGFASEDESAIDHAKAVVVLYSARARWSPAVEAASVRGLTQKKLIPCYLDVAQSVAIAAPIDGDGAAWSAGATTPIDLSRMERDPAQLGALTSAVSARAGAQTPPEDEAAVQALLSGAQRDADDWRAIRGVEDAAELRRYLRRRGAPGPFDVHVRRKLIELQLIDPPSVAAPTPSIWHVGAALVGATAAIVAAPLWTSDGGLDESERAQLEAASSSQTRTEAVENALISLRERVADLAEARDRAERDGLGAIDQAALDALEAEQNAQSAALAAAEEAFRAALANQDDALVELREDVASQSATLATVEQRADEALDAQAEALTELKASLDAQSIALEAIEGRLEGTDDGARAELAALRDEILGRAEALTAAAAESRDTVGAQSEAVAGLELRFVEFAAALDEAEARDATARGEIQQAIETLGQQFEAQSDALADAEERERQLRLDLEAAMARLDEKLSAQTVALAEAEERDVETQADIETALQSLRDDVAEQGETLAVAVADIEEKEAEFAAAAEAAASEREALKLAIAEAAESVAAASAPQPIAATAETVTPPPAEEAPTAVAATTPEPEPEPEAPATPEPETAPEAEAEAEAEADPKTETETDTAIATIAETEIAAAEATIATDATEPTPPAFAVARRAELHLNRLGYDVGAISGAWVPKAREAMRRFQGVVRLPQTGYPTDRAMALLALAPQRMFNGVKASVYYRENEASLAKAAAFRKVIEAGGGVILNYRPIVSLCNRFTAPEKTHFGYNQGFGEEVAFMREVFSEENSAAWEKKAGNSDFLIALCGD